MKLNAYQSAIYSHVPCCVDGIKVSLKLTILVHSQMLLSTNVTCKKISS